MLASFVHLHFGSRPGLAAELVERCTAVNVLAVKAAAAAAAEAAGPRSFSADAMRARRGFSSAHVSPESGAQFSGAPRPIFPVRHLTPDHQPLMRIPATASLYRTGLIPDASWHGHRVLHVV